MPAPDREILVAGACTRPVVRSIKNAGHECRAIDLFADWDTAKICTVRAAASMQAVEQMALQSLDNAHLALASGGENFSFVDNDHDKRPWQQGLLGSKVDAIRCARDPVFLHQILTEANLPTLPIRTNTPSKGDWIWKPRKSCGGHGIQRLTTDKKNSTRSDGYFQQFQIGRAIGAAFLSDGVNCELLECVEQQHGLLGEEPFTWHSACSTSALDDHSLQIIKQVGLRVAQQANLIGWFGVDFIVDSGSKPFLLEVNPRHTATMEIWERRTGQSLFALHLALSFGAQLSSLPLDLSEKSSSHILKSYLYNKASANKASASNMPRRLTVSKRQFDRLVANSNEHTSRFVTDIPCLGTVIEPNDPVCTTWITGVDSPRSARNEATDFQNEILAWFD